MLTVLSPLGETTRVASTAARSPAGRKPIGPGATIGVIHNSKPNADVLLDEVRKLLISNYGMKPGPWYNKKIVGGPGFAAPDEWLDDLCSTCDAVLIASGDCGGCSSYCIVDAVNVERRGVPTIAICTTPFESLAREVSDGLGMPDLFDESVVVIPHPLMTLTYEQTMERALEMLPSVVKMLNVQEV